MRTLALTILFALIAALRCGRDENRTRPLVVRLDSLKATASWSPNAETDLRGYRIHYGKQSGSYDRRIMVPATNTSVVIAGLDPGSTYFFVATAFDTAGNESLYSEEVSAITPPDTDATADTTITAESELFDYDRNGTEITTEGGLTVFALKGQYAWVSLNYLITDTVDIAVLARGDQALGTWPNMRLALDTLTNAVASVIVANQAFMATSFSRVSSRGAKLFFVFTNDEYVPGVHDRNLYVRSVTIRKVTKLENIFDLNNDAVVDVLDWIFLLRHIGTNSQSAQFRPEMDFNADLWIDGMEKAFFAKQSKFI